MEPAGWVERPVRRSSKSEGGSDYPHTSIGAKVMGFAKYSTHLTYFLSARRFIRLLRRRRNKPIAQHGCLHFFRIGCAAELAAWHCILEIRRPQDTGGERAQTSCRRGGAIGKTVNDTALDEDAFAGSHVDVLAIDVPGHALPSAHR